MREALRIINDSKKYDMGYIDESIICAVPEISFKRNPPYSIHFKGKKHKKRMIATAEILLGEKSNNET